MPAWPGKSWWPALAGLALALCASWASAVPSYQAFRADHRPSDLTLLDRNGTPIQTLRLDNTVRRLDWVPLQDLSPALLLAMVLSEDQRFWQHSGIDWQAVASSAWANLLNSRTRGASTLTMQLAGLMDDDLARPASGRSPRQKLQQALAAKRMERQWTKSQILEAYLNAVPFRGELVGINALSQTLFGKHPSGLDVQEAAIAAVLVRAPNAPARQVAQRACGVVQLMGQQCTGLSGLTAAALVRRGGMPLGEQLAPHLARQVLRADGPPAQRSTLHAPLQRLALAALREHLGELQGHNAEDGAIVVLDNRTGEVLAWVGSSGSFSDAPQVDGVLARRQPGSTLKPFVYALAFERGLVTPATLLSDSPAQLTTGAGLYLPQNYDRHFRGWVSARTALGSSLNVPAVRVASLLPPDALFEQLNRWGLALPHSGGYYGHALALGGVDVTLLSLANAYRGLANGGVVSAPRWVLDDVTDTSRDLKRVNTTAAGHQVADAAAVFLVTDILADNSARVGTFGLASALATRGFAAVKTGTSKDLRDNWCLGFTDRYTVGVWVGNASGEAMHGVSGISGAAPIWQRLVQQLHQTEVSRAPPVAKGVVLRELVFADGQEPARSEYFIRGTEQRASAAGVSMLSSSNAPFGITNPRNGSVFALDPDIPPSAQKLRFEGQPGVWTLNGQRVGQGASVAWRPRSGRHRLVLSDSRGREVQAVEFVVRAMVLSSNTSGR